MFKNSAVYSNAKKMIKGGDTNKKVRKQYFEKQTLMNEFFEITTPKV